MAYISNYEKKWGNTGSDVSIIDVADNPSSFIPSKNTQSSQPLSVALNLPKPYTITPKSQVLGTSVGTSTTQTNTSQAPAVKANTSDLNAQIESIKAQIADKQKQVDEIKSAQSNTQEQPQEQSSSEKMWQSLLGQQQTTQQQIAQSQQTLIDQQNAIYEKWGLTPEKYQRINDITAQVTEYQKQLAELDTKEQEELASVNAEGGQTIGYTGAVQSRIQRNYSILKSGVAAQASILSSEAQALQGNWDNAFKSAQLYIENATTAQRQIVSDLQWGFSQYADIIKGMTAQEQDQINLAYKAQQDELDRQQTDYWKQLDMDFKEKGLQLDYAKYNLDVANTLGQGGTSDLLASSGLQGAFEASVSGTPYNSPDRKYAANAINNQLASGDVEGAKETIVRNAVQGLGSTIYQKYINGGVVIDNLSEIQNALEEYKAAGGNTNIFNGAVQTVLNKLGTTSDPTLAGIENRIKTTLTQYITAVSGVQFSDEERKVYQSMFPSSYFGGQKLNISKIGSLISQTETMRDSYAKQALGTTNYNSLKGGTDLLSQVNAKGYDYNKMKTDGYSDEEIRSAVGIK